MQTVPADANLGRMNAGKAVGYRVLTLDRAPYRAFTVATETIPGHYVAVGGVSAPNEGGYIVWGLRGQVIAEATIEPAPVDMSEALLAGIAKRLDALLTSIKAAMPTIPPFPAIPAPVVEMDTSGIEERIVELRAYLAEMAANNSDRQTERISELQAQIRPINDAIVVHTQTIGEMRADMSTYFEPPVIEIVPEPIISKAAQRRAKAVEFINRHLQESKHYGNGKTD